MKNLNICYIDDKLDPYVSEYLENYTNTEIEILYEEYEFSRNDSYNTLLNEEKVKKADILIIDSMLFENNKLDKKKISGEELGLIIKKIFPYKEIIVVTQYEERLESNILKKYNSSYKESSNDFFEKNWKNILDKAITDILFYQKIIKKIKSKNYIEKYLVEKLENSLKGDSEYENLTVKDIDNLIEVFEELRDLYDKERL